MIAYWYPDSTGTVEVLSLTDSRQPTDLQEYTSVDGAEAEAGTGLSSSVLFGRRTDLEITIEDIPLAHEADRRAIRNLVEHLKAGGRCGISLTTTKAYGTFTQLAAARGDTSVRAGGASVWYNGSAQLASGDAIVLETGAPGWLTEEATLTGALTSSSLLASTSALLHSFPTLTHLRHRDFYPICRMTLAERQRDDQIRSNGRITYDVTLRLRYCLGEVMSLAGGSGARVRQVGQPARTGEGSIESILGARDGRVDTTSSGFGSNVDDSFYRTFSSFGG